MGYFIQNKHNQRNNERFIVLFFFLYNVSFCAGAARRGLPFWVPALLLAASLAGIAALACNYKNFKTRARLTTALIMCSVTFYASFCDDASSSLPSFMFLSVLTAFYGISELTWMPLASLLFILFYHAAVSHSMDALPKEAVIRILTQSASAFCLIFALRTWLKSRKESNEQIYKMIDALIEAEQSKDDFLSNISHEIRTPVNTVTGMSELALRETDPEKIRKEIFDIRDAGRNLMSLVSDILDFAQLEQGKMALEEEHYNIASTINDIISTAMARKGDKPIELIADCSADMPAGLYGDEKKIRRVIMNLVDNAIKYTESGCVCICVDTRRENYGVNLRVTVKDSGIGISEKSQEKLFESFSQVDTRKNRSNGGIGLGLAISKELVLKMGGTITARSQLAKGSMFRFVVPQKVVSEEPIGQVLNKESLSVAAYFDMEQFDMMAIRDEYSALIEHMTAQLQVKCRICRNLAELKRRASREAFTHIFISLKEYLEDASYFDAMAGSAKVVAVIERADEPRIQSPAVLRLYKPFYLLPVVSILNGSQGMKSESRIVRPGKFTAKDVHVLVVDDNKMNIRVIEGLLGEYRIKVTSAESGREALKKIEQMSYDFVFMDHMMPDMDGVETLRRIRDKAGNYYRRVPIVALTANAAPGSREMFLEEGFSDFLAKPVELSVLERLLKRTLPEEKLIYQETEASVADREKDRDDRFLIGSLDVSSGMLYCGGRQAYLSVLRSCRDEAGDEIALLDSLYRKQDWNNYAIRVHALKSAMKSIGAASLSELAKALEQAGKTGDTDYIVAHHEAMTCEYRRIAAELSQSPLLADDDDKVKEPASGPKSSDAPSEAEASEKADGSQEELDDAGFDERIARLEESMYGLDGSQMLAILEELQAFRYRQVSLAGKLDAVRDKIKRSDYMSAVDLLAHIRDGLKKS